MRGAAAVLVGAWLALALPARAQIVLDGSLGTSGELLPDSARDVEIPERVGRRAGVNLFHSFAAFGIPEQTSATFTSEGPGVSRVFARVTGAAVSRIDGALRSRIEGADLYLLNPNGVLFGRGASLDLPASLRVSAGESLLFPEGVRLWADPSRAVTLSAEPPSAWGFGPRSGAIAIDGSALRMRSGAALSLAGGSIDIRGRPEAGLDFGFPVVTTPEGALELVAVDAAGDAPLGALGIDASGIERLGSIRIHDSAQLDGTSAGASRLRIRADSVELDRAYAFFDNIGTGPASDHAGRAIDVEARGAIALRSSALTSEVLGSARSGDIHLDAPDVRLDRDSFVVADVGSGSGRGGDVDVRAGRLEILDSSELTTKTLSAGDAGDLAVHVDTLLRISGADSLLGSVTESSGSAARGAGGDVSVDAQRIELDAGGQILVRTRNSSGDAGRLQVHASEIEISGSRRNPSGIFSSEEDGAQGRGGDVEVDGGRLLRILGGGRVAAYSTVAGDNPRAGEPPQLVIRAERVELSGFSILEGGERSLSAIQTRGIDRDAGRLEVESDRLVLAGGALVSASTAGAGRAGEVVIRASSARIEGTDGNPGNPNESGIYSQALEGSTGPAGTVRIAVRDLEVIDGGRISVVTVGTGSGGQLLINEPGREEGHPEWSRQARIAVAGGSIRADVFPDSPGASGGSIEIHARELVLADGRILAENRSRGDAGSIRLFLVGGLEASGGSEIRIGARSGAAGNVEIRAGKRVSLVDSTIATNVTQGGPSGGNVDIDPELVLLNRSSIQAHAADGNGGSILIRAGHFVRSADSELDVSSILGIEGTVVVDSPVEILGDEVVDLPDRALDASDQLRRGCAVRNTRSGSLTVSERVVRIGSQGVLGVEAEEGGCARP